MSGTAERLRIAPVTLTGRFVRLEPLATAHVDALAGIASEPSLWTWFAGRLNDRASLEAFVADALAAAAQRTAANTEAKYLMLSHAFDTLRATRVELKAHSRNEKPRRAIERIGAQFEGIHRKHMLQPDGSRRDSAWYSIIDDDWPAVKARLEAMLR